MKNRISKESILTGCIAGLLWGSWAYYVHYEFGFATASQAALSQGIGSAFVGTILTMTMDYIYKIESWPRTVMIVASIVSPMLLATGMLVVVHLLTGTPDILQTMLPSQPLGYAWTTVYTVKLYRRSVPSAA